MKRSSSASLILALASSMLVSCISTHPDPYVRHGRSTGIVAGGITGAIIGNNMKGGNSWGGAAIGAALGGMVGDSRGKTNSMYYNRPYNGRHRNYYYYY